MAEWRELAACIGMDPSDFFEAIWDEAGTFHEDTLIAQRSRACAGCAVRRACLEAEAEIERGLGADMRFALRAYLTPGQREAVEKRGILRCPNCNAVRDPVLLAQGKLRCPVRCGQPDRDVQPPPFFGDQWTKRHTTLSARVVAWIIDNSDPEDKIPNPGKMAELMGGIRRSDVLRVYKALIEDGLLTREGPKQEPVYRRGDRVPSRNWRPNWTD